MPDQHADPAPTLGTSRSGATQADTEPAQPSPASSVVDKSPPLPASIGRYRILRLLGEGGMGAVYEAEQEFPHRTVALKVIRAGYASGEMLRRFETETQALGRLQHPGIAQIYEAGTAETPFGRQPYFAMELVQGQALIDYCESHRLGVRQRLELMAKICDAVQHAHQRGLIHRDLKPANILVDESGQPRILDFGVARLTDSDAQATRQTDIGQLVGTLAYMSPEQVLGDPGEIDTRSDVYALGVILYELLAGRGPYVLGRQLHEVVRTIREEEPSALSSVNRSYRGDIETIVGKALEKDKTRRYVSAAELAADIQRHLRDEPITARPPTTSYQLRKFARRNKALVTGAAAVLVVLVLGVVASTWEAVQARRAEAKAKQESAISQAVNDFLQKDLLGQASAYNQSKPDPDIKVRTVLDRAAQNIQGKFEKQPAVEAAIWDTIGNTYERLGLYPEAQKQLERALELSRGALGPDNPRTLLIMQDLVWLDQDEGKYIEAEALGKQTLDKKRRVLGPENPETLAAMGELATVYWAEGKYARAEALDLQTLEMKRRVLGADHPWTLSTMNNLAVLYSNESKYAQAEALQSQALEIERRSLGPEHPATLMSMNNLATVYADEGKYARAEALHRQALEVQRRVLGPEHPETLQTMYDLAGLYRLAGKYAEAEAMQSQTLEIRRRVLGPDHPNTLGSMEDLAWDYVGETKYAQAATLFSQILGAWRRLKGPEDGNTLGSADGLAVALIGERRYDDAEKLLRETLDIRRRVSGPDDPSIGGDLYNLACTMARERHKNEALALLAQAIDHGLLPSTALAMDKDTDLTSLHGDPRFDALVAHAKQHATAASKSGQ